jgi:hypothetical protein
VRFLLLILCSLCCSLTAGAQIGLTSPGVLKGQIVDAVSGEPLTAVTVINAATQQSAFTDASGTFVIRAAAGQRIIFSYLGYKTQELKAPEGYTSQRIELARQSYQMNEYIVRPKYTPYQADSIQRHSTYQRALARKKGGSLGSPVTLLAEKLSKRSKQIFRFQQEFNYWEDQRYIDTRYTPELVGALTRLEGDTLASFMNAYPMPHDYARAASELELKMWIRTNYREWLLKQGRPATPAPAATLTDSTAVRRD